MCATNFGASHASTFTYVGRTCSHVGKACFEVGFVASETIKYASKPGAVLVAFKELL